MICPLNFIAVCLFSVLPLILGLNCSSFTCIIWNICNTYASLVKTDLCELAADSTFGFEARFWRVLLVLVCSQAARAAELLKRLAGVDLCHNGTLHVRDVPEKHKGTDS